MAVSVGKIYADALFGIIDEDTADMPRAARRAKFETVLGDLAAVYDAFCENPDWVTAVLSSPCYPAGERAASFEAVFGGRISVTVENLVKLMIMKSRARYVRAVYREFTLLYNALFDIIGITVTSAYGLTNGEVAKIASVVSRKYGGNREVTVTEKTDRSLIGGAVIDIGGERLDGSVKANFRSLRDELVNTKLGGLP